MCVVAMTSSVTCFVCGETIKPGERRKATSRPSGESGTRHWSCGAITSTPAGVLGQLEGGDVFEISFNGEDWHYASVEGAGVFDHEYVVRAVLQDVLYAEESKDSPLQYTDQFDIVTTPNRNSWGEPVAFEVEPDWPAMEEGPGRSFEYNHHKISEVEIRPTDVTAAQYDWEFWNNRPTDPVDLYERYMTGEQTTTEIAEDLGVSGWTVRNWMDRVGIERRAGAVTADQRQNIR